MILIGLCAAGVTAGLGLLAWAMTPRRPSLAAELDQLLALGGVVIAMPAEAGFLDSFASSVWATVDDDGQRFPALAKDLAVTGDTPVVFVRQILTTAGLFAALALGLVAMAAAEGLGFSAGVGVATVVAAGLLGAVVPRPTLHSEADGRRQEMREAVAVICDLAAVLVAAGDDIDGALVAAAGAGSGWSFETVRAALPTTGRTGTWTALEALGDRLGVDELVVLAQNMGLAEEKGAKVREALNTQAKTLRAEAASEVEASAGSMTERMSFPMVMLLAGFLVAIGYPAVARL